MNPRLNWRGVSEFQMVIGWDRLGSLATRELAEFDPLKK